MGAELHTHGQTLVSSCHRPSTPGRGSRGVNGGTNRSPSGPTAPTPPPPGPAPPVPTRRRFCLRSTPPASEACGTRQAPYSANRPPGNWMTVTMAQGRGRRAAPVPPSPRLGSGCVPSNPADEGREVGIVQATQHTIQLCTGSFIGEQDSERCVPGTVAWQRSARPEPVLENAAVQQRSEPDDLLRQQGAQGLPFSTNA
jgi:hypothetical protein